jgi:hypothetical protein
MIYITGYEFAVPFLSTCRTIVATRLGKNISGLIQVTEI